MGGDDVTQTIFPQVPAAAPVEEGADDSIPEKELRAPPVEEAPPAEEAASEDKDEEDVLDEESSEDDMDGFADEIAGEIVGEEEAVPAEESPGTGYRGTVDEETTGGAPVLYRVQISDEESYADRRSRMRKEAEEAAEAPVGEEVAAEAPVGDILVGEEVAAEAVSGEEVAAEAPPGEKVAPPGEKVAAEEVLAEETPPAEERTEKTPPAEELTEKTPPAEEVAAEIPPAEGVAVPPAEETPPAEEIADQAPPVEEKTKEAEQSAVEKEEEEGKNDFDSKAVYDDEVKSKSSDESSDDALEQRLVERRGSRAWDGADKRDDEVNKEEEPSDK